LLSPRNFLSFSRSAVLPARVCAEFADSRSDTPKRRLPAIRAFTFGT
jgi:hypothetical protein